MKSPFVTDREGLLRLQDMIKGKTNFEAMKTLIAYQEEEESIYESMAEAKSAVEAMKGKQ
jgi:hypothetical protein